MPTRLTLSLASALTLALFRQGLALQSSLQRDEDLDNDDDDDSTGYTTAVRHIGDIKVVTVETRAGDPMKLPGRLTGEHEDTTVTNVGAGQKWKYYRTKNGLMLKWINETIEKDPNTMAIMIDGGDMVYGGCDEKFLMSKYNNILKASGGGPQMNLVMSAELACFPLEMGWYFRDNKTWEARRTAVNSQVENLKDDWVDQYAPCSDHKIAPCDAKDRRGYRYPNWGFVMGPVKNLKPLFEFVYNKGQRGQLDQMRAQWWMLSNFEKITLDYSGSMVMSIHNMAHGRQASEAPIELTKDKQGKPFILNKVTNQPCCFAHGNGNGEALVTQMARQMNNLTGAM